MRDAEHCFVFIQLYRAITMYIIFFGRRSSLYFKRSTIFRKPTVFPSSGKDKRTAPNLLDRSHRVISDIGKHRSVTVLRCVIFLFLSLVKMCVPVHIVTHLLVHSAQWLNSSMWGVQQTGCCFCLKMEVKPPSETSPLLQITHCKMSRKEDCAPVLHCNCLIWMACRVWTHQERPYDTLSLPLKITQPTVYYMKKCGRTRGACSPNAYSYRSVDSMFILATWCRLPAEIQ